MMPEKARSLEEAWLSVCDMIPPALAAFPGLPSLLRSVFLSGATHAVGLMERGHYDQLRADLMASISLQQE